MTELDYFYCSDSEKCPFYEKWRTKIDRRIGIIIKNEKVIKSTFRSVNLPKTKGVSAKNGKIIPKPVKISFK